MTPEQTPEIPEIRTLIRPRRKITGYSAVLLPFTTADQPDWASFENHVRRTLDADLVPAVNMDTGYVNLLDAETRIEVLKRTRTVAAGRRFAAGAFVTDNPGAAFSRDAYAARIDEIAEHSGIPVLFQSYGLTTGSDDDIAARYQQLASICDRFIAFELSDVFLPLGRIYSLSLYAELMKIPNCIGAKHSSLRREPEWQRLMLRDQIRPDFMVMTGNDLAIDMVMYGSDYLLGLSSFAPDYFSRRDRTWHDGDPQFYELNDVLQYLGFLAFRSPVPAYKHNCAQFLKLRGMTSTDLTHPKAVCRPDSDTELLADILRQLERFRD